MSDRTDGKYAWDDPWYDEAEKIAENTECCGESQLAYNIAELVRKYVNLAKGDE